LNIEYIKVKNVKIQNRKTGFGSIYKPVFGFAKTAGFPGYPVSVKTGLQTLVMKCEARFWTNRKHRKMAEWSLQEISGGSMGGAIAPESKKSFNS